MKLILYLAIIINSQIIEPSKLYKEGNYSQALEIYISMIKKDPYNAYLYYNAGNCYYKMQNKHLALAYYLKAFTINPRLEKNLSNLKKLSQETENEIYLQDIPDIFYKVYYLLSENEIKTLLHISSIIFIISIALSVLKIKSYKKMIIISLILSLLFILWISLRKNSIFHNPAVTLRETDIFSGPNNKFTVLATVPQAKILIILNKGDEFSEVGIPSQNLKGWIKNEDIILIREM